MIEQWLNEPTHQELYFQWLEEWELENMQLIPNADKAYARLLALRRGEVPQTKPSFAAPRVIVFGNRFRWFGWVAAAVLVVLSLGGYLFSDQLLYKRYETSNGEVRTVMLADQSQATLNANSELKVPRFDLEKGDRRVWLNGEAEFVVTHKPDHRRFVVQTSNQLEVKVLGTEFIVYSRARGSKVVLKKGKVQLRSLADRTIVPVTITPGDVVYMSKRGHLTLKHHQAIATHEAWKEKRFTFENTPVSEVAYQLTEQFGVPIIVTDSLLAQRTIGGTFKVETAADLLTILKEVLKIKVIEHDSPTKTIELITTQ